ncbi:VCBS repeat-containing protein [Arthrobacter sp. D1-29]
MAYSSSSFEGRSTRNGRARLREGPSRGTARGTTAALLCALLIAFALVPVAPAEAMGPVLTHFERTSPDTIDAGDTVIMHFSTDIPVAFGRLRLSNANGQYPPRDFSWGDQDGPELTQHVISLPTDAGSWLGGLYLVESISFWDTHTHSGGTTYRSHPGGQWLRAADFTVVNTELTAARPDLVGVEVTSGGVLVPGEEAVIAFSLSAPAQKVKLHFNDESLLNAKVFEWTGSPAPRPFTGEVRIPIDSSFLEGEYQLKSVAVSYLGGQAAYSFGRGFWPNWDGDFFVVNPDKPLQTFENLTPPELSIGNYPDNVEYVLSMGDVRPSPTGGTWSKAPTQVWGRWLRDGKPHCGAMWCDSRFYATSASDMGSVLEYEQTAMLAGHRALTVLSNPIYFSRSGPTTVTGGSRVGSELRASFDLSTVTALPEGAAPTVGFEWKDSADPAIILATGDTYRPTQADVGRTVRAVAVVDFDGQTVARSVSNDVGPIGKASRLSDFNGDGFNDLFAVDQTGVLRLYGARPSGWESPLAVGRGWGVFNLVLSPGDFNGDGNVDVMARDSSGNLLLYQGDGRGGWLHASVVGTGWSGMTDIMGPGDFNGDGTSDVLAKDRNGRLLLYPGNGHGGWLAPFQVGQGWNIFDKIFAPGDFDGDGGPDVLARNSNGELFLYQSDGLGGIFGVHTIGTGWDVMANVGSIGDTSGDGWNDLYAIDRGGVLMVYHHNATGWTGPHPSGPDWNTLKFVF